MKDFTIQLTEEGSRAVQPELIEDDTNAHGARERPLPLLPLYSTHRGLKPKDFEIVIPRVIAYLKTFRVAEPLPSAVIRDNDLMGIGDALEAIHMPR